MQDTLHAVTAQCKAASALMAAITGKSIERITELAAHYENGLVYYRRPLPAGAVPVWGLEWISANDRA